MTEIRPNPGRQTQFLASSADLCIYGGAAGGGKSFALLLEALRHINRPGYVAKIFRRTYAEATGPGSLWDATHNLYALVGGTPNESNLTWTFPSGAQIGLGHLQHEKDRFAHMGAEYAFIGFDELTRFTEDQFWFLLSRNRSTCGIKPYIRATCNPDPDHFVKRIIRWWLDDDGRFPNLDRAGVIRWMARDGNDIVWQTDDPHTFSILVESRRRENPHYRPISVSFVPASLDDNPALLRIDPGYKSRLMELPLVERQRLLYGDWLIRHQAGTLFRADWFGIIHRIPPRIKYLCRYWDRASTEVKRGNDPDYTAGVLMAALDDGTYVILDVKRIRGTPLDVQNLILRTAEHDRAEWGNRIQVGIELDPGQAGKFEAAHYSRVLAGHRVKIFPIRTGKIARAQAFSAQAEAGNVLILYADWNTPLLSELAEFPDGPHDDQVDACSGAFNALIGRKNSSVEGVGWRS